MYDNKEDYVEIEIKKIKSRVPRWKRNPHQINSRLLNIYMQISNNGTTKITRDDFQYAFERFYTDPFLSNYNQMKNFGEKNHGKIFEEDEVGTVTIWRPVAEFIKAIYR